VYCIPTQGEPRTDCISSQRSLTSTTAANTVSVLSYSISRRATLNVTKEKFQYTHLISASNSQRNPALEISVECARGIYWPPLVHGLVQEILDISVSAADGEQSCGPLGAAADDVEGHASRELWPSHPRERHCLDLLRLSGSRR
jgi:hypothetical protein